MILGIDYGQKYLGLAISAGELAQPKGTLAINQLTDLLAKIHAWEITRIVIGLSEGKMAEETKVWGKKLEKMVQLPVVFCDETLSSHEAGSDKDNHAKAAAVILQRYLDENRNTNV